MMHQALLCLVCGAVSTVAGDAASVAGDTANTSGRHRVVCDVTFDLTSHIARVKLIYHTADGRCADVLLFYPPRMVTQGWCSLLTSPVPTDGHSSGCCWWYL